MKKTGIAKLIAVASALVMLLSQVAVSANFVLTAENVMDGATREIPGFLFDSQKYSKSEYGRHSTYGEYQERIRWRENLMDHNWSAGDSQNIYPIGTPDTNYYDIVDPQSFAESPYADYEGVDVTVWNGYMFVVLQKTTWVPSTEEAPYIGEGAIFESAIQVYDIANGKKDHVATWDAKDLNFGGTAANLSQGIRQIAVNDEHIFMLVDICAPGWMHRPWGNENGVTSYGCGLAVYDNNISREDGTYDLPTRSACQTQFEERPADNPTDREKYGVDTQWRLTAKGSADGGEMYVRGDYLVYIPQLYMNNMAQGDNEGDDIWKGIHFLKWNDPDREATAQLYFDHYTFMNWLDISFPEEYKATETHRGEEPDVGALAIEGDYMYIDVVYTTPNGGTYDNGEPAYDQYDQLYVVDISDILNPVVVGTSAPIKSRNGEWNLNRKLSAANGFVYFGYNHWNPANYQPYVFIMDVRDKQAPVLAQEIMLKDYDYEGHEVFGISSIIAVGNIVIAEMDSTTIFFEMNSDKTEILDTFYAQRALAMWGPRWNSRGFQPFVYGSRIFYPALPGKVNQPNEDGTWPEPTDQDGAPTFLELNRIEVVDFSAALPMGFYVDDIANNGDDTYTISGTLQGVEILPSFYGIPAINVNDENGELVGEIYYEDLVTEVLAESDSVLWSFTTEADMPSELTFVVNDSWGDVLEDANGNPLLYENVNLELVGIDPVFTLTGTASGAIAAGEYSVTASASNMTANDVEGVVIVAVYDAAGKLVAVATGATETIASAEAKDLAPVTVNVPQADSYEGYTAKALMLDGVESLAPICENLTF